VVAGVSVLSGDGSTAGPPVLRLAGAGGSYSAAADSARGSYRLTGTLPDGPSEARIRDLPATAAPVARVRVVASALGEAAAPVRSDGAWKAGELRVTDEPGNPWTWGYSCGPDTPVSSDGGVAKDLPTSICAYGTDSSRGSVSSGGVSSGSTGSGVASDGNAPSATAPSVTGYACPSPPPGAEPIVCDDTPDIPVPEPLPPEKVLLTESQALTATVAVRNALGLGDAPARVEGLSVIVEPLAGGLPTSGMATLLQLSSQAKIVGASGSMSTGREGDLYPLRTASQAFDAMPVFALGAPCDAAGCPEGPAVTGARLGLSRVTLDEGAAALVPAWLFTVKDSPVPMVALAVVDRFLGGPDPTRPDPGTEPGVEPTAKPGITEPDPGGSVAPSPPANGNPADPTGREPFGFDGAYGDANPKVLVVRYGDSGSCPSQTVRHEVVEQPDRVVVTLTRTPMPADRACTMDYQAKLVRAALTAPLGKREVVDGSRKEPVPISTGTPPFG
jgi:hypothetical protein